MCAFDPSQRWTTSGVGTEVVRLDDSYFRRRSKRCWRGVRSYYSDKCRTFAVSRLRSCSGSGLRPCRAGIDEGRIARAIRCPMRRAVRRDSWLPQQPSRWLEVRSPSRSWNWFGARRGSRYQRRFEEGDTFTLEPALYGSQLRAGLRLEQDYVIENGRLRRLSTLPLDIQRRGWNVRRQSRFSAPRARGRRSNGRRNSSSAAWLRRFCGRQVDVFVVPAADIATGSSIGRLRLWQRSAGCVGYRPH